MQLDRVKGHVKKDPISRRESAISLRREKPIINARVLRTSNIYYTSSRNVRYVFNNNLYFTPLQHILMNLL